MRQGTSLGSQIGRWIFLAAVVVALGALLLTIRPVGAQDAPPTISDAQTVFNYAENGDKPIITYRARDPETKPVFWTLVGVDARHFTIFGGELSFKSPPNFEMPLDSADTNTYKVTVRFGAGGQDGTPAIDDYDGDDLGELELTVNVTNVDEDGRVTISPLQPQIGTLLRARLSDSDVQVGYGQWKWASSESGLPGTFTDLTAWVDENVSSTANTYRPVDGDLDKYLQVSVRYKDRVDDSIKTVSTVSDYTVRKDIVTSNADPKYPDQRILLGGRDIERDETRRYVPETVSAGTYVGAPVTAFDDETSIDVITYSLLAGTSTSETTGVDNNGHTKFVINPATGQIMVASGARFNRTDDTPAGATDTYGVTVIATDGDGQTEMIVVDIRVVKVDEPPSISRVDAMTGMVVAPIEMSHYEANRTVSPAGPAVTIDTDLDTAGITLALDDAVYRAMDPEDTTNLTWSLEGDDGWLFHIEDHDTPDDDKDTATLSFKTRPQLLATHPNSEVLGDYPNFPDFENERDANKDNVYEVTIVVTDSTLINRDELDVTVKVINSTEDNRPGKVLISNRQPEGASKLTATIVDADQPIKNLKWQWYRSAAEVECGAVSAATADLPNLPNTFTPNLDLFTETNGVFAPIFPADPAVPAVWQGISGATSATYTPQYDEDTAGFRADAGKCLLARATYTDWDAADPTMVDDPFTADIDESKQHEMAYGVSEHPVQVEDKDNPKPQFRADPRDPFSATVDSYRVTVPENTGPINIGILEDIDQDGQGILDVVVAAVDDETGDTDTPVDGIPDSTPTRNSDADDILTYTLSGPDAKYFKISGSIAVPVLHEDTAGQLMIMIEDGLNHEKDDEYRLTLTATDPSGDSETITVIVNVTDENDQLELIGPKSQHYMEDRTDVIATYTGVDEDTNGITYTLVPDVGDHDVFTIDSLTGALIFRSSPNYELPEDDLEVTESGGNADIEPIAIQSDATNNEYLVAVRARVAGTPEVDTDGTAASSFIAGTGVAIRNTVDRVHRIVRIKVLNVNEPPVFAEVEDTLEMEIKENPDDPVQDPKLNRGVGGNPTVANPDVGIPVIAIDDDNEVDANNDFPELTPAEINEGHMVDGLTYTLSGADAGLFDIVRATGQILNRVKLNYETKTEYNVTVTATDTGHPSTGVDRLSDSIDVTIMVTDVDEVPVPKVINVTGDSTPGYAENGTDAVGEYAVSVYGGTVANPAWTLEGTDADDFMLEGSGSTRMLKFQSAPDFEDPTGGADDDSNTYNVTMKVTDPSDRETTGNLSVIVTVTNIDELGALTGMDNPRHTENSTDAVATYTVTGGDGTSTVTWDLGGDDADQFMLEGTGMERMLKFKSAPDYEAPADADGDSFYEVTVMVEAGTEEGEREVTVKVNDVIELGTLAGDGTHDYAENGTDAVGTYMVSNDYGFAITWDLGGDDADQFMLEGTGMSRTLMFESVPDYEAPADANGDNVYTVTVMVEAGTETDNVSVTIEVADVDELGTLSGPDSASVMEGATDALGTYTLTGTAAATADWSLDETGTSDFMLEGTGMSRMLKFSSAPDYETPMGGADNNSNTYMVTVMASAGGEEEMMAVAITVDNVDELGALGGSETASINEGATDVGTYALTGGTMDATATWNVEGADAGHFTITGGMLKFSSAPDYENPMGGANDDFNTYMVTVMASAGGEEEMMAVAITVDNVDELGALGGSETASINEGATDVGTYALTGGTMDATATWNVEGADAGHFTITGGMLKFSSAPDYENPMGGANDDFNTYMVTVMASAGGEEEMMAVAITVDNVDELGALGGSETASINEGATDVGTYALTGGTMDATATWNVEGADAGHFTITGGMLKFSSAPDYEMPRGAAMSDTNTNEYMVTVKASAGGEMAMQAVNVMVTNVVELGMLTADMENPSHPENSMDTVATYTVSGGTMDATATWNVEGADADYFTITDGMLKFSSAPDYEMPRGAAMSDTNTNEYMVTVKASAGSEMAMQAVTVEVTDVDELGTLSGPGSPISYMENGTMTVATYTASGPMADNAMWTLDEAGTADFTITGGMLEFMNAPDYENPMGGADDDSNTYMVTVKASAGGDMAMREVTVEVTDVDELGTLSGPGSPISYMENGTMTVATYTASGPMADNAMWTLDEAGTADFTITGGMLEFMNAPDYENPMGGADDDSNTYMVTVKASAGGEMEMREVTVTVTDVDETVAPAFPSETATRSIAENTAANTNIGDPVAATDPNDDTLTYSLEGTDAASFGIDGSTGQLSTLAALDFETKTAYTVVVKATDPGGLSDTIDVTINVTDVDENVAPAFPSATATRSIAENTAANTNIGDPVAATDPNGDTLTYSLEGTDAASFDIDGSTGQLRTSAALDFETKTPYTVVVKATDPDGLSDTIDVTINVTDVDDGAVTPVDLVGRYDTNGTEGIQIDELFDAIDDYFAGGIITIDQLFQIIDAYFLG